MYAWRFDQSPDRAAPVPISVGELSDAAAPLLAAVVYPNEAYPQALFQRVVELCRARALKIAGVLQHPACDDPAHRCDVILEDLMTGERTELFERRGRDARGCRLDLEALTDVSARIELSLQQNPALLLLNKFGKVEAEGGGLLDSIAMAFERNIPTLIGVPERNLEAWRAFSGSTAELRDDLEAITTWLGRLGF